MTSACACSSMTFKVLSKDDIKTRRNGFCVASWSSFGTFDETEQADIKNHVLRLDEGLFSYNTVSSPYESEVIDLQPIRNMFVSSPNFGSYNASGVRGKSDII